MNEMLFTVPCADYEHDLVELLEGSLGPERARIIRLHVESCPRCRAWQAEFAAIDAGRTQDQGIHVTPRFPPGVDYLFTLGLAAGRVRDALRLLSRALQPPGSLCTFRRCTAGLAQGCHPHCRKVSLNSSRPLRGLRRGGTLVMSPLH